MKKHKKEVIDGIFKKLLLFLGLWSVTLLLFLCFQWYMEKEEVLLLKDTGGGIYELKTVQGDTLLLTQKLQSLLCADIGESRLFSEEELLVEEAVLAGELDALFAKQLQDITELLYMGKGRCVGGYTSISCEAEGKSMDWRFAVLCFFWSETREDESFVFDAEEADGMVVYDYDTKRILQCTIQEELMREVLKKTAADTEERLLQAVEDYYEGMELYWDNQEVSQGGMNISIWDEELLEAEIEEKRLASLMNKSLGITSEAE